MGMLDSFRDLLKRGEPALPFLKHPVLGPLTWVADEEAWSGQFGDRPFLLGYDGSTEPNSLVVAYAQEVLGDSSWLRREIDQAKDTAPSDYRPYAAEIRGLVLGPILFYSYRGNLRMFVELSGGQDFRCWRIEFAGKSCEGIGFDS